MPQGSILGPLLFLIFVNDLPEHITNSKIVLYADDTILLFSDSDFNNIKRNIEMDLSAAQNWFQTNKLHVNVKKTQWMLFGTQQRLKQVDNCSIFLGENKLERVYDYKYLGVKMDSNLRWDVHIECMCTKISQRLGVIQRVHKYVDHCVAKMLYNSLVLSVFDYCDIIYGSCCDTLKHRLQKLQNRGARLLLHLNNRSHVLPMLNQLKWLDIDSRIKMHVYLMVHRCLYDSSIPSNLKDLFITCSSIHNHRTRISSTSGLHLHRINLVKGQNSFRFRGSALWNELPSNIRCIENFSRFKSSLIRHLLDNIHV